MSEVSIRDAAHAEQLFAALSEQLAARGESHTIVVVGGSALVALGFVSRPTRDVDVVALLLDEELVSAEPLPDALLTAVKLVADDFGLPGRWLNSGPTTLLDFGLPPGFLEIDVDGRKNVRHQLEEWIDKHLRTEESGAQWSRRWDIWPRQSRRRIFAGWYR